MKTTITPEIQAKIDQAKQLSKELQALDIPHVFGIQPDYGEKTEILSHLPTGNRKTRGEFFSARLALTFIAMDLSTPNDTTTTTKLPTSDEGIRSWFEEATSC